ncbi:HAD domain-containing protein [Faecalicoccus acidiformans]|uniref:HAD domain-containing protein n=1 Tax=Faecalicoccus acidiformans TaxID=915173 RepID=UPI0023551045|nr:HAD domain-containing protein [Faecalicoccus acidiformans]
MHPVLFLDIDGVLHPQRSKTTAHFDMDLNKKLAEEYMDPHFLDLSPYFINHIYYGFDQKACSLIAALVSRFDAHIVLTSSWRMVYTHQELYYLFKILHMEDAFVGITKKRTPRQDVIREYIEDHDIKQYLVIDDQEMTKAFPFHAIHTQNCFNEEDYHIACTLLEIQHVQNQ